MNERKKGNGRALLSLAMVLVILITVNLTGMSVLAAAPTALPLINHGLPAYASSDYGTSANDNNYGSAWRGAVPGWVAFDLSSVPVAQRGPVVVVVYNTDTGEYDHTVKTNYYAGIPKDYTIEANAAVGGTGSAPASGWVALATVTGNAYHSRQTVVNLTGYNWVRVNISTVDSQSGNSACINIDIHNASQGIQDDWIFYGDSITQGCMVVGGNTTYAQMVNAALPSYYPIVENGGIGGIFSWNGAQNIDRWLTAFPGKYVGIAYGTNDAWGNQTGAAAYYTYTETIVKAVLAAGKVPIVSKIPYSTNTGVNTYAPDYNKQIDALYAAYPQIIKGPDFWTYFQTNPGLLGGDGVHPSDAGYLGMRQQWLNTMIAAIYNSGGSQTPTPTPTPSTATATPTPTPSVATATPTPTPSTATATPTPTPSTATAPPTPTPSIATATPTPTPSTATATPTPSTATPTPTPTAGTPVPGGIKVQFFNGNTAATTNTIYPNFKVVNTGTAAISLSDVKVRYYFTNDGTQANSFACDYSTIGSGNVTGSFTTIAKTNADRYLEVGFSTSAGTLAAGAGAEVKGRIWKADWSNFTQTNDYSFNATATNYVDSTTVTGWLAGALKWGTEP